QGIIEQAPRGRILLQSQQSIFLICASKLRHVFDSGLAETNRWLIASPAILITKTGWFRRPDRRVRPISIVFSSSESANRGAITKEARLDRNQHEERLEADICV